jgi:radical SAM superfamily enzyme YgiQ (UPF0313 family)
MTNQKTYKKILLINPPSVIKRSWVEGVQSFPLGLASMAAVLDEHNYEVKILDCFIEDYNNKEILDDVFVKIGMSDEAILDVIREFQPDLIGIAIQFSIQLLPAQNLNKLIKEAFPDIVTAVGGNHATAAPHSLAGNKFDWLVLGEGEFRILKLLDALSNNTTDLLPPDIAPLTGECNIDVSKIRIEKIKDLDVLPMPKYDLLSLDKYWELSNGEKWVNLFITRGCPFDCVFCSIQTIMGGRVRYKSLDKVIEEIEYLKNELGVEELLIEDDNMTYNMEWAKGFFRAIIAKKLKFKIHFRNGVRADKVDMELLKLMRKAGVMKVAFAPESGSQATLDNIIHKHMKLEDVEIAVKLAIKADIYVKCFLVVGFPEETLEEVQKTFDYARKLKKMGVDHIWISCAVPYPGTKLFDTCVERGIIPKENVDYQDLTTMESVIYNEHFTAKGIKKMRDDVMCEVNIGRLGQLKELAFSNPKIFFQKIRFIVRNKISDYTS